MDLSVAFIKFAFLAVIFLLCTMESSVQNLPHTLPLLVLFWFIGVCHFLMLTCFPLRLDSAFTFMNHEGRQKVLGVLTDMAREYNKEKEDE